MPKPAISTRPLSAIYESSGKVPLTLKNKKPPEGGFISKQQWPVPLIAFVISSTTFLASPKIIIVFRYRTSHYQDQHNLSP